jgi:hypothetical protein
LAGFSQGMKRLSKQYFLARFSNHGIALDTRYDPPQTLGYREESNLSYSFDLPHLPKDLPYFITRLVDSAVLETKMYLFPRANAWNSGDSLKLFQTRSILSSCGIDSVQDDVLEAEISERDGVETLLLIALLHGGTVSDDLFLMPDHARVILYADHHEAVHAEFRDSGFMNEFVTAMDAPAH